VGRQERSVRVDRRDDVTTLAALDGTFAHRTQTGGSKSLCLMKKGTSLTVQ
jgi:hypothetical protein